MLYSGSFRSIQPDQYDQIWLCVRSLKAMPKNPYGNIFHIPELSPSTQLFFEALNLKKAGKWNNDTFNTIYLPKFVEELKQPAAYQKLEELVELSRSKNILIVCYCSNESLCHRRILKTYVEIRNQQLEKE